MRRAVLVVLVAGIGLVGCGGENVASPSGIQALQVVDLQVGTGAEAVNGTTTSVEYTGWPAAAARDQS